MDDISKKYILVGKYVSCIIKINLSVCLLFIRCISARNESNISIFMLKSLIETASKTQTLNVSRDLLVSDFKSFFPNFSESFNHLQVMFQDRSVIVMAMQY